MSTRFFMRLFSAVMLTGALLLSGCASHNMESMDDNMKPMGDSMDKPMMKESMDKDDGMKDSM